MENRATRCIPRNDSTKDASYQAIRIYVLLRHQYTRGTPIWYPEFFETFCVDNMSEYQNDLRISSACTREAGTEFGDTDAKRGIPFA